ncbi:MAG: thioredoxin family protein [Muribaculaceae bacterium]|nr:thioredoxin family protein [Muribaculaceae bacterium]
MRKKLLTFAAVTALIAGSCSGNGKSSASDSDSTPAKATSETSSAVKSDEKAQNYVIADGQLLSANGLPMVVDFSAEWCPPCRQLKPIFASLKEEYKGKVDFVTINVDSLPDLASKYKIESIPALIFISRDGQELYRSIGFREALEIKADITKYLN